MPCRYILSLLVLSSLCLASKLLVKGDTRVDDGMSESHEEYLKKTVRQQQMNKHAILANLFLRIKKPNLPPLNLTETERNAIGKRTAYCLGKKSNKRTTFSRTKNTYERDKCIIVPPLCSNDLALKDQKLPVSFLFEANSLYKKNADVEVIKVISMNLNLKLHKKGAEIAKKSHIYLKIYGVTNKPTDNMYLLKNMRVVPGKNRWIKVQLGKEFSKFRRDARHDGNLKPFGISLLLENDENDGYIPPEDIFHEHRCTKMKRANSSFSMPHLMVAQMTKVKHRFTMVNVSVVKGSPRTA